MDLSDWLTRGRRKAGESIGSRSCSCSPIFYRKLLRLWVKVVRRHEVWRWRPSKDKRWMSGHRTWVFRCGNMLQESLPGLFWRMFGDSVVTQKVLRRLSVFSILIPLLPPGVLSRLPKCICQTVPNACHSGELTQENGPFPLFPEPNRNFSPQMDLEWRNIRRGKGFGRPIVDMADLEQWKFLPPVRSLWT